MNTDKTEQALTDEQILMIGRRAMDKCFGTDAQHIYIAREVERAVTSAPPAQPGDKLWCETCEGSGQVHQESQNGCHVVGNFPCPDCDGKGYWHRRAAPPAQQQGDAERLSMSLAAIVIHWREFGPYHGFEECVDVAAMLLAATPPSLQEPQEAGDNV